MIKPKPWGGHNLTGDWQVTFKLDGVQARLSPASVVSRADKPLYNLDHLRPTSGLRVVEVFKDNLETSLSIVTTHASAPVDAAHLYELWPELDPRLDAGVLNSPTAFEIAATMGTVNKLGYEGLVLRQGDVWLKVKPFETHDVFVTGVQRGKPSSRHADSMGALLTTKGKVSAGFDDATRALWWTRKLAIEEGFERPLIEVECQRLTPAGRFRHARFKRERFDKTEES